MSCCGTNPGYDELDEVSRLVSAKLAAFLRTLRDNGFAVGLHEGRDAASLMTVGFARREQMLERHARRARAAALSLGQRRHHRIEERQGDGGPQTAQERSSSKRTTGDEHQRTPAASRRSSSRRDRNGTL